MGDTIYVLGHSQAEIRRLIKQASIVQATTERLLRSAGIERGMRVLDLGCGAGDVSMLAATLDRRAAVPPAQPQRQAN